MTITYQAALRELAEPWTGGERLKIALDRAARRAGLAYWRTYDIWYGKAKRISDAEHAAIADALAQKRKEEARRELHDLRVRMARMESLFNQIDADFFRPTLDPLRQNIRRMGGKSGDQDRTVD